MRAFKKFLNHHKIFLYLPLILVLFSACKSPGSTTDTPTVTDHIKQLVILYTNDEHGWMESTSTHGGAAGMMGLWKSRESFTEDGAFLVLSGGDMWTGPAVSTWTKGRAMTSVMNAMGYDAAAIGNHEFDFGPDQLLLRIGEADFPFLSANIRERATGRAPPFATPYIVKEVNGIKVGIIGLSSLSTPTSTLPSVVAPYDFIGYATALTETVPQARADGAELLVVVGHICTLEMVDLAPTAANLGIAFVGGGHCHESNTSNMEGVIYMQSNGNMRQYAMATISFDTETDSVISITSDMRENTGGTPDPEVEAVVSGFQDEVSGELSRVIGYTAQEIPRFSAPMHNMVTDSWLVRYPIADISMTNSGGIRQAIPAGEIRVEDIVSALPFENTLYEVELTGAQVVECIDYLVVGGMTTMGGYRLLDGTPIDPAKTYKVLTINFLYHRSDFCFLGYDNTPYDTSIHYRQPIIDWIESLNTSESDPLDNYLDYTYRK